MFIYSYIYYIHGAKSNYSNFCKLSLFPSYGMSHRPHNSAINTISKVKEKQ